MRIYPQRWLIISDVVSKGGSAGANLEIVRNQECATTELHAKNTELNVNGNAIMQGASVDDEKLTNNIKRDNAYCGCN